MYQPTVKRLFDRLQPSQVRNVASLLAQALIRSERLSHRFGRSRFGEHVVLLGHGFSFLPSSSAVDVLDVNVSRRRGKRKITYKRTTQELAPSGACFRERETYEVPGSTFQAAR